MNPSIVSDLLDDLLAAAVDAVTDPPSLQGVRHGVFAHDCEMLVVHCSGITFDALGDPSGNVLRTAVIPAVELTVTLVRCWPVPEEGKTSPPAATITTAARGLATDGAELVGGLAAAWADGTLFPTADVNADDVTLIPGLSPVDPEGGLAGWRFALSVLV